MTLELLAESAIRALLLGAAAWLAMRVMRVRNPHVHKLVWRVLLVAGLALPALLYWRLAPAFAVSLRLPVLVATDAGAADAAAFVVPRAVSLASVLMTIYLGVALLLLVRFAIGLAGMWRICRGAQRMDTADDVRTSARIRSPATFGSIILLPAAAGEWSPHTLEAVLAHERAHVRSRDCHWSWLAQLHGALFWFNPLSWWLHRRLDTLAETTSDDAVIAARHDPLAYAALLLDFARSPNSRRVAMSAAESNVPERIERLLARTPPAAAPPRVARWSALALLIPAVMLGASTTRAAPPAPLAAAPVRTSNSPPPVSARILKTPFSEDYYPAVAKAQSVSGSVVVEVDVDALGQLVDARVVEVQPADPQFGFADAALRIARAGRYESPSQQPSSFKFRVNFEPKKK